jgi:NAD+ synthase
LNLLEIDCEQVRRKLVQFIREFCQSQGYSKVVIGLSGGLDSTVAAYLAVEALGQANCIGVFLPHQVSQSNSLKDAQEIAAGLKIPTRQVDITSFVEAFKAGFGTISELQLGNIMARCRMIVLHQISAEEKALVLGTSNKSEILMGYGTLYGDLACALDPLGDLYKTQVRQLAVHIGVPEKIIKKVPSADLWEGQSDEEELGVTYGEADRFLLRWVDGQLDREELLAEGFTPDFTDRMMRRVNSQRFKSSMPPIPKITRRVSNANLPHPQD